MTDVLVRIKRAVLAGRYAFSEKARLEMEADGLNNDFDDDHGLPTLRQPANSEGPEGLGE